MMPKANPDVIVRIPQTQFQAVQTRLTDVLLQSHYAFMQSFTSDPDTTFHILCEPSETSTHESLHVILCPASHGTSVAVTRDRPSDAAPQSAAVAALMEHLIAVCISSQGI